MRSGVGRYTARNGARTILVADGDPLARGFSRDLLHSAGFRVRVAGTGPEVLQSIRRSPPDLLLLDVRLPEMHGLAVCEQVRATNNGHHLPIILVTEPGGRAEMVKGFEAGADDFVLKPVDQAELMARVRGHLRTKTYRDEIEKEKEELASILDIAKALTSTLSSREIFSILVERTAKIMNAVRCSLVVIRGNGGEGQVVASSEGPAARGLVLDLRKYPEIRRAIQEREVVLIQDVQKNPLMASVRELVRHLGFRSILVVPITLQDNVVGTLLLSTRSAHPFSDRHVRTCEVVAEIAANALQNAHVFESLQLERVDVRWRALEDARLGVYHSHVFDRRLEEEMARAYRYRQSVACMAIRASGGPGVEEEAALRDLATLIKGSIRRSDVIGWHPSGCLLLMLPITPLEGAKVKGQRLQDAVLARGLGGAPAGAVSISIGVTAGIPDAPEGGDRVVAGTLAALQEAQSQGANTLALRSLA